MPLYAGNYHGRNHEAGQGHAKRVVRLEAALEPSVCKVLAHDARSLNAELARMGFPGAGEATTGLSTACAQLLALGLSATVQLDVHEDGSLANTFGLTLFVTSNPWESLTDGGGKLCAVRSRCRFRLRPKTAYGALWAPPATPTASS